jgi:hypothetical protein
MYKIVSLKAFGDFVIACYATRFFNMNGQRESFSIVAGSHVRPLVEALKIPDNLVFYISDSVSNGVPAIFDIRRAGFFSALRSLSNIRGQFKFLHPDDKLVFDRLGWRERLLGFEREIFGLPNVARNIYVAYDLFFESIGCAPVVEEFPSTITVNRAVIIPGARMGFRIIPPSLILKIYKELEFRGIQVKVIFLEGEKIEVPRGLAFEVLPRSFSNLVSSIRDANFVVSADSLPAHLSAFLGIPIFVFTPIPEWTLYWLPKSAFTTEGMATFADIESFRFWLNKNLRS